MTIHPLSAASAPGPAGNTMSPLQHAFYITGDLEQRAKEVQILKAAAELVLTAMKSEATKGYDYLSPIGIFVNGTGYTITYEGGTLEEQLYKVESTDFSHLYLGISINGIRRSDFDLTDHSGSYKQYNLSSNKSVTDVILCAQAGNKVILNTKEAPAAIPCRGLHC